MRFRPALAVVLACTLLLGGSAHAKIDPACSSTTATSAITGTVQNAQGEPLGGMKVELFETNRSIPTADSAVTDAQGRYRICAGQVSGSGHNAYDVHVRDLSFHPVYALESQPYTTYLSPASDADFTPASGHPLRYMTYMQITPGDISTVSGPVDVTWLVRSKAPALTAFSIVLEHRGNAVYPMTPGPPENGGPGAGGWHTWTHTDRIPAMATEKVYAATARGVLAGVEVAQMDRQYYAVDNSPPLLGPATTNVGECGPGIPATAFSPASPPGTTNPLAVVTHGVCDKYSNGARTGLDPYTLTGRVCRDALMSSGCRAISPVLNVNQITWYPPEPMALGDHYFEWTIADYAGNETRSPVGHRLTVVERGGQVPIITAVQPGNFGSGNTSGVIIGSSVTSPTSYPYIGFRVLDADGQRDLAPGSLRVRVYYADDRTLVYDYDPSKNRNEYDPVTARGGANWDLGTGFFRADGYPLQSKPPGRYIATASITDHGGNNATFTWHWILAAAV